MRVKTLVLATGLILVTAFAVQATAQTPPPAPCCSSHDELFDHIEIVYLDDGAGNPLKTIRFHGVNVQIVNDLGATNGYPTDPLNDNPANTMVNGLGNLIVGYNEPDINNPPVDRTGSHNLVAGSFNNFTSYGGFLAGRRNKITGIYSSVAGGRGHGFFGSGDFSAIIGGISNTASGLDSLVCGGGNHLASGQASVIIGGGSSDATGNSSVVVGGTGNLSSGDAATTVGGVLNVASGTLSLATGGEDNLASGYAATVSGGATRSATGIDDWVAGSLWEDN